MFEKAYSKLKTWKIIRVDHSLKGISDFSIGSDTFSEDTTLREFIRAHNAQFRSYGYVASLWSEGPGGKKLKDIMSKGEGRLVFRTEQEMVRISATLSCCSKRFPLNRFTNRCPECGARYNQSGQALSSPSQWGEETGEIASDILQGE